MQILRLTPEDYVVLNDVNSGGRKLGVVDGTGTGYFDLVPNGELPKPLYDALSPQSVGSIASWIENVEEGPFADEIAQAWIALTKKNLPVLTIARAVRFGVVNQIADVETLEKMGVAETEQIIQGRRLSEVPAVT